MDLAIFQGRFGLRQKQDGLDLTVDLKAVKRKKARK